MYLLSLSWGWHHLCEWSPLVPEVVAGYWSQLHSAKNPAHRALQIPTCHPAPVTVQPEAKSIVGHRLLFMSSITSMSGHQGSCMCIAWWHFRILCGHSCGFELLLCGPTQHQPAVLILPSILFPLACVLSTALGLRTDRTDYET